VIADDRFLIITGLSGSGKTIVSRFLEDMGYYCIDNLPTRMIPLFVDLWKRREFEIQKVALVVDIREHGFLTSFPEVWTSIRKKIAARLIFLDASDEALVKRFSETRRPHPLAPNRPALQGVRLERKRLAPIKAMADDVIDTSGTSIQQLRELFGRRVRKTKRHLLHVQVRSFGYKYGIPIDADLVFDTRFLPNPFYRDDLRARPGTDRRVRSFVLKQPETLAFLGEVERFLHFLMPRFIAEGKSQLVIAIGCTGGRHRSVVVADALADSLRGPEYDIKVFHRDVNK
jgi:UPF0042 nucleotide-binding protein